MSSEPIPIPTCKADHRNDDEIAYETQMYEESTWRMYHLICQSRLIRAGYFMDSQSHSHLLGPSQHQVVLERESDHSNTSTPSPPHQLDEKHQDRMHSLPEPPSIPGCSPLMDEMFVME
eukprot:CAMPEP_0201715406 /NCGR_PEP_ID=MMETSP0593-20130828/1605_1 /ASSEMBLY_ACC=CAM_ASM_000672 /TAXON_ID=267983 /ORGANISM="Skeletonema japonicum, Strain CCMP2506" /LENGTH=118 /DNA_ID=CAMNT_0048204905 /DNA_START=81 /DNA_END=437 /DNA_ORIENTATION=-